jgi:hypothetical protein
MLRMPLLTPPAPANSILHQWKVGIPGPSLALRAFARNDQVNVFGLKAIGRFAKMPNLFTGGGGP